jgi:hypothetical protein
MLINGADDILTLLTVHLAMMMMKMPITVMMILVSISLWFRCLNIKTTKIKTVLQVDLRGVTEIIFSEIHSVNLFLTKVLNWGSLTLTFRNINRYSLAFYQDPAIRGASPSQYILPFSNINRYSLIFSKIPKEDHHHPKFRNINRYSLIFTKISKERQPHPLRFRNINRHTLAQPHLN